MTARFPISPQGTALDTLALGAERDAVSLQRRVRARAVELRLPSSAVRGIGTAAHDLARLLLARDHRVTVEIRIAPGRALEVCFASSAARLADVGDALAPIAARVDGMSADDTAGGLVAVLSSRLPERPSGGASDQSLALQTSVRELQSELEETNRGVVALYAELDDQAEKLRSAEDRLRILLDSVQDYAICMLKIDGEIASWNAGAERIFGYSADEIVGRNFACFYTAAERDLDVPAEHLTLAHQDGRFECEGLRVRRGGSAFDAHVVMAPVRAGQPVRGFSLVVRDVTERKRLEDSLRRRAEDLAAANRAKEDFLATLSHELRTPLNAMLGWTRLLRMGKLHGAAKARALETIERNAHVQEQLIADILDVSRIVTGKLRLELRPMDVAPIVDASVDALRPAADAKGILLSADIAAAGAVLGDPDRLQQVVWNLLSNAIKFTPSGGTVRISLARAGPSAVVTVADSGEGISPDLLPFVFDRFTQGDASVTRPHGGLGLGLSIVRHIVELHGGQVEAWSDGPERGATFSVRLPIRAGLGVGDDADARGVVVRSIGDRRGR